MNRKYVVLALVVSFAFSAIAVAHGKGHVKGTISAVGPDHLMVKGEDGKEIHIPITAKTKFFKGKAPAAAADAKVGSRVVVHLSDDGNAMQVQLPEDNQKK